MPEEPSESFFSKLKNLFKADSQSSEQTSTQQLLMSRLMS